MVEVVKIGMDHYRATVRRKVAGAPQMPVPYSRTAGAVFQPDTVEIEYRAVDEDQFSFDVVTVSGGKIKKDGTPGMVRTSSDFYRGYGMPEWLTILVAELRPTR